MSTLEAIKAFIHLFFIFAHVVQSLSDLIQMGTTYYLAHRWRWFCFQVLPHYAQGQMNIG